ncbi:hypothetical protein [Leifsonia poae]|uniref:hypothetical protein n=1 Tax=Leifsonia poae TaxID=110933 RepID=UPI001CBEB46F|nr:hypothetical protein [Leifsonia poae]
MSQSGLDLAVGAEPRVDLLPPEVRAQRKSRSQHRMLGVGVLGVLVLTFAGVGGASALSLTAQSDLALSQTETGSLLAQQQKFIEVRKVQEEVKLVQAAQEVGASTEIDWRDYLLKVQATLPAEVVLQTINIDSSSPLTAYTQPTVPLQGARVATLSFTAQSPTLPQVPSWLDSLASLPGFVDATPGSVTLDDQTHQYTVNIVMHINEAAYSKRFAPKGK